MQVYRIEDAYFVGPPELWEKLTAFVLLWDSVKVEQVDLPFFPMPRGPARDALEARRKAAREAAQKKRDALMQEKYGAVYEDLYDFAMQQEGIQPTQVHRIHFSR